MRIFAEVPRGGASNDSAWACRDYGNFQRFRWLFFSDTLEMRPVLLYSCYMQSVVGFSAIPKCLTLNNPDWQFRVCFRAGLAR